MTDLLIRNMDDETLRRIDAIARRQGLTRAEYLRRELDQLAARSQRRATRADLDQSLELLEDLSDVSVMMNSWQ